MKITFWKGNWNIAIKLTYAQSYSKSYRVSCLYWHAPVNELKIKKKTYASSYVDTIREASIRVWNNDINSYKRNSFVLYTDWHIL